ncbi:MAG: hypothetical protein M3Y07_19015 [Acidobacteriota bacterium]|nr:hypothetical protein [Acidobacteriota bacterium]
MTDAPERTPAVDRPNLVILAGPNGSGKSTLFDLYIRKWSMPFVNRDVIAKGLNLENPDSAALRALRIAAVRQKEFFERRESFVTESIRPDPELIRGAQALGYKTRVIFICLQLPDLNVARVANRVSHGGHSVPVNAILKRYDRALAGLVETIPLVEQLLVFDNSIHKRAPRFLARFKNGELVSLRRNAPGWANRTFGPIFDDFRLKRRANNP